MIVVVGNSHAGPLGRSMSREDNPAVSALKRRFGEVAAAKVLAGHRLRAPFFRADGGGVWLKGQAGEIVADLTGTDGGFRPGDGNVYGFSMGFHTALLLRQEYWRDFTLLPDVEGKAFVSAGAYRKMVLHDNTHVLDFARALVDRGVRAFMLAGAPIRSAMIERQAVFARREEMLAMQQGYVAAMEEALHSIGMPFVSAPTQAAEGGALKPEYDSAIEDDVHHGNPKFGLLQWQAIAEHCGVLEEAA